MATRAIKTITKGKEECALEFFFSLINIVVGVYCGLSDKPNLFSGFCVAVILQATGTMYKYFGFLFENKKKIAKWFGNIVLLLALTQGLAVVICFVCISVNSMGFGLPLLLSVIIALPLFLLIYELIYHMK